MSFATEHPNLDYLLGEFIDGALGVKRGLADGKFNPDEVIGVLEQLDPALANYIGKWMKALKGIYPEMQELAKGGPFRMLMEAGPYFAGRFMEVFK